MAMTLDEITAAVQKIPLNAAPVANLIGATAQAQQDYAVKAFALSERDKKLLTYGGGALAVVFVLALLSRR